MIAQIFIILINEETRQSLHNHLNVWMEERKYWQEKLENVSKHPRKYNFYKIYILEKEN